MGKKKFNIHNQLKDFRLDEHLTLTDLAFLLDIKNVGRISEWENNKAYPGFVNSLALEIILHRYNSQTFNLLRKELAEKIEIRKGLLLEKKKREKRLDKG
jgi:transcriptional regulator with XRE-family HTH domain